MREELKDGLELRSLSEGNASDRENLAAFYMDVFGETEDDAPALGIWTRDLVSGMHPTVTLDDIWVVVDPSQNERIVSALLLIPQTWCYEDVSIGVGRVELVATHKDYRCRGLIRALMNAAHRRSTELGHIMQSITGIPHYYRQFGYAMTVDLGMRATLAIDAIPEAKADQPAKFTLRDATTDDIPNLVRWSAYYAATRGLTMVSTSERWDYELNTRSAGAPMYQHVRIISRADGEDVGFISLRISDYDKFLNVFQFVIGPEASYLEAFDDVMRGVKAIADAYYAERPEIRSSFIWFDSGVSEAVDKLVQGMPPGGQARSRAYAWYIRVPDIVDFIRKITPVLERRLIDSAANCYTGALKVDFFDMTGITITFERGRITSVERGEMTFRESQASFPYDMFLNVVMGHRTVEEIHYLLPDAGGNRDARVLLEVLFPLKRSFLPALS